MSDPGASDDPGAGSPARKARGKSGAGSAKKAGKASGKKSAKRPGEPASRIERRSEAGVGERAKPGKAARAKAREAGRAASSRSLSPPAGDAEPANDPAAPGPDPEATGTSVPEAQAGTQEPHATARPSDTSPAAAIPAPTSTGTKKVSVKKRRGEKTAPERSLSRKGAIKSGAKSPRAKSSRARSAGALLAEAAKFTAGLLRTVVAPAVAPFVAGSDGGEAAEEVAEPASRAQVGVLPVRRGGDGRLRVLLVTSRETRRWVIPKGWPMRGRAAHEAAAREAFEEAGLVGRVGERALGRYAYRKRMKTGTITCVVEVFPFRVRKRLKTWPEKRQRTTRWFAPEEAASLVAEPDLAALIREVAARADPAGSG